VYISGVENITNLFLFYKCFYFYKICIIYCIITEFQKNVINILDYYPHPFFFLKKKKNNKINIKVVGH